MSIVKVFIPSSPNVNAVPAKVLLALKAPAVDTVRAFTPFVANVKAVPANVELALTAPSAATAPVFDTLNT